MTDSLHLYPKVIKVYTQNMYGKIKIKTIENNIGDIITKYVCLGGLITEAG